MLICTCHLIIGGYIWALHLISWPSWTLHMKTWPNSAVCDLLGHFIWNLTSFCHCTLHLIWGYIWQLIWVLHLTNWPRCALHLKTWPNSAVFQMGSHWWHRSAKTSSPVTGSFMRGYVWELIWVLHLKIWTHLPFYALLHRRSFHITYEGPNYGV